eukprot:m.13057 g.13057  ORF g.13057 m.13057 type:complete len:220 (+) comp9575_c0_seq1:124-783(+)
MGNFFGNAKKEHKPKPNDDGITELDKTVLKIKTQRDRLTKYQKKITAINDKLRDSAKILAKKGQKEKALAMLKKRRVQETMLKQTDGQISNLEDMVQNIEVTKLSNEMLDAMKGGNDALKILQENYSVDDVADIMDDAKDGIEYANEIAELTAGKLTAEDDVDIDAELAAFLAIGEEPVPDLPEVPLETLPETPDTEVVIEAVVTEEPPKEQKKIAVAE